MTTPSKLQEAAKEYIQKIQDRPSTLRVYTAIEDAFCDGAHYGRKEMLEAVLAALRSEESTLQNVSELEIPFEIWTGCGWADWLERSLRNETAADENRRD